MIISFVLLSSIIVFRLFDNLPTEAIVVERFSCNSLFEAISLMLSDKYDQHNALMEIHPGAGGTEAMDWADMLLRMYQRYASNHGLKFEIEDYEPGEEAGAKSVSLLHCTTNYPCPMHEVNLRAIQTLKDAFHCSVGYSDHTMGVEVPVAAVAMGAEIIEKHFTLDKEMDGPDHKASLNPEELKQMVVAIRHIEQALGDGIKQPNESEKQISEVVLKRIVAATPIKEGEVLSADNMTVKRSTVGLKASLWDLVNGRIATCNYAIDEPIII